MISKHPNIDYLLNTAVNYTCGNMAEHLAGVNHVAVSDFLLRGPFRVTNQTQSPRRPFKTRIPGPGRLSSFTVNSSSSGVPKRVNLIRPAPNATTRATAIWHGYRSKSALLNSVCPYTKFVSAFSMISWRWRFDIHPFPPIFLR